MNFEEAVEAMKEGKKLTRPNYVEGVYFESRDLGIIKILNDNNFEGMLYLFNDIEATDWEVVDEDKDWNLGKQSLEQPIKARYISEIIKKCRDLIQEDLSVNFAVSKNLQDLYDRTQDCINDRFGELK